jgi:hypothetical protein
MTPDSVRPGVPCYLVALQDQDFEAFTGRVVEVIAGPIHIADEPAQFDPWFQVGAPWIAEAFNGDALAPRRCLKPIIPPAPALPAAKKRTTEKAT